MQNNDIVYVYRHKDNKDIYLLRKYQCVGGARADHFYEVTTDFKEALKNTIGHDTLEFECHLRTPYNFNEYVDDTVPLIIKKEFEFDGYKGVAQKEVRFHLCDFEKVIFEEVKDK